MREEGPGIGVEISRIPFGFKIWCVTLSINSGLCKCSIVSKHVIKSKEDCLNGMHSASPKITFFPLLTANFEISIPYASYPNSLSNSTTKP